MVIAVGGNALVDPGDPVDAGHQRRTLARAVPALAAAIGDRPAVLTHGNGPQVGQLAALARAAHDLEPLDVLDALSQGMIGYLIEEELSAQLPDRSVVSVLTRVEVDAGDPAFTRPTKPVGQKGTGRPRHLVPSPEPLRIVELEAIRTLVAAHHLVVALGGGGVPVAVDGQGHRRGVEAVVDKDLASSLLAVALDAELLVLLTDVDAVESGWGGPHPQALGAVGVDDLDPSTFESGSMRPKVEAARRFVMATGRRAAIGALSDVGAVVRGDRGTQVRRAPG